MKRSLLHLLRIVAIAVLIVVLEGCSGNPSVSTGIGIHRSSNGDWGHSISVGIHSHGRQW